MLENTVGDAQTGKLADNCFGNVFDGKTISMGVNGRNPSKTVNQGCYRSMDRLGYVHIDNMLLKRESE